MKTQFRKPKNPSFETRFWSGIKKTDSCWLWCKARTQSGYGLIGLGRKLFYTHRVSYEFNVGPIPDKLFVLHKCDNPPCVNPEHLWVGTNHDNVKDMCKKGRHKTPWGRKK